MLRHIKSINTFLIQDFEVRKPFLDKACIILFLLGITLLNLDYFDLNVDALFCFILIASSIIMRISSVFFRGSILLYYFWILFIVYSFPFFFIYELLINQKNVFLAVIFPFATIGFGLMVSPKILAHLALIGGFFSINACLVQFGSLIITDEMVIIFVCSVIILLYFLFFLHQTNLVLNEKMLALRNISGRIAHEIRTPLVALRLTSSAVESLLPKLLEAHDLAEKNKISVPKINDTHKKILSENFKKINNCVISTLSNLDVLLFTFKENLITHDSNLENLSIRDIVLQAVNLYPFREEEFKKVNLNIKKNFYFKGNKSLMINFIWNLLKNSLQAIEESRKGEVFIETENRLLVFRDTAKGATVSEVVSMFQDFYTTKYNGTGFGLPFCKKVIKSLSGQIYFKCENNKFLEFLFYIPEKKDEKLTRNTSLHASHYSIVC